MGDSDGGKANVAVALHGVAVRRGGRPILRDVSLTIRFGDLVVVAGANGEGKSSLLRVLAGVAEPAIGRVERGAETCAFVPERVRLAPVGTPVAWLGGMDRVRGVERGWPRTAAAWGVVEPALRAPVSRLSKGQLQRVALAEALTAPARLLVLDEPWAGLDADGRTLLARTLGERAATGAAVVVSDHTGAGGRTLDAGRRVMVAGGAVRVTAAEVDAGRHAMVASPRERVPDAAPDRLVVLARRPGAGAVERHVIALGEQDELLRELLAAGWSIEDVRRA